MALTRTERQLHTRTRPKVVLARTFAEAEAFVKRYKPFLHGVISDLQVAMEGKKGQETGTAFLRHLLDTIPGLPILLMSADETAATVAHSLGIEFVDKNSPRCVRQLEDFCMGNLGFGDFVFRDRHGREILRARNLRAFENALHTVPEESIEFHSRRNQFSHWLSAQGEAAWRNLSAPCRCRTSSRWPICANSCARLSASPGVKNTGGLSRISAPTILSPSTPF